ncbi:MFS transporter [Streptomyces sp. KLMMK]|uniref:MFS transporter n=1 Tax=Streptomyces sp. KLMMK TaxID=3109353 RepID=UPI00300044D0
MPARSSPVSERGYSCSPATATSARSPAKPPPTTSSTRRSGPSSCSISRELHFSALLLGTMLAMSGVGAFAGSVLAGRLARRWGLGRTIVATTALACAAPLLIPIAGGSGIGAGTGSGAGGDGGHAAATAVVAIAIALLLNGAGMAISNIHVVSLRQTVVPPELLGRTNAGYRFLVTGTAALGALLGGWLGGTIGLRATLTAAGLATLTALLFVVRLTCR